MFKTSCYFLCISICLVSLSSCSDNTSSIEKKHIPTGFSELINKAFTISHDSLTVREYMAWLKEQKGFTFDKQESEKTYLSILYKPLKFEAALSMETSSPSEFIKNIDIKKGFHYLSIECLDKNYSLSEKTDKEVLINRLKENFYVVKNESDTIRNIIIEIFPAHLINQPDQLLVLVPASQDQDLEAGIKGKAFGVSDLRINISNSGFKSFPEIKI